MGLNAKLSNVQPTGGPITRSDLTKAPVGIYKEKDGKDGGSNYIVMKNKGVNIVLRANSSSVQPLSDSYIEEMGRMGYLFVKDSVRVTLTFNNNSE